MMSNPIMSVDEMTAAATKITGDVGLGRSPPEMLHEDENAEDDQSGGELLPELVKVARKVEIEYFRSRGVYDKVPIKECWDVTGAGPISVRWVDINKGDTSCPNYRSRAGVQYVRQARLVRDHAPRCDVAHHPDEVR